MARFVAPVRPAQVPLLVRGDADGDGKAEISVFRPTRRHLVRASLVDTIRELNHRSMGSSGDIPVIGDFDGDGKTELTSSGPRAGNGISATRRSPIAKAVGPVPMGPPRRHPACCRLRRRWKDRIERLPAFDRRVVDPGTLHSGTASAARPPTSGARPATFPCRPTSTVTEGVNWRSFDLRRILVHPLFLTRGRHQRVYPSVGPAGRHPAHRRHRRGRHSDLRSFEPKPGTGLSVTRRMPSSGAVVFQWGEPGDLPIALDFDGDGKTELTVYRPSTGQWFIRYSSYGYARV